MTRRGFTLIELMVVIAVIGVLAATMIPSVSNLSAKAKVTRAIADFRMIDAAASRLFVDLNAYPAEGPWCVGPGFATIADVPGPAQSAWKGPYLKQWPPQHPFGGCITYLNGGSSSCFDRDGVANNDAFAHYYDAAAFTDAIKREIDKALDDGNLSTGVVKQCRGGLAYLLGEGPTW